MYDFKICDNNTEKKLNAKIWNVECYFKNNIWLLSISPGLAMVLGKGIVLVIVAAEMRNI